MVDAVNDRAQTLFKMLVECYLADGVPVPSKRLASHPGVKVSSATIRNIMSELESRGLVRSPHTSAGKIPTNQGLRFFVDSLLRVEPLDEEKVQHLEHQLSPDLSPDELITKASSLLSRITQMTCLISLPRRDHVALRLVEFLPLSGDRVLVILVLNDREVQNRVIHTEREYSEVELTQAANFINREFGGLSLMSIRAALLASMQDDKDRMDTMMQSALDMASQVFVGTGEGENERRVVVSGEDRLLRTSLDDSVILSLFDAFSRKGSILHLLDRALDSDGIQLFIGEESGYELFDDVSVVTAPYEVGGRFAGVLGVVGPTRMAYQDVIPVVDVTARVLGAAISQS
ncbi:MAG: heat-inducible transcriptional repressor HrcA [Pseudomonadales bacterium]|nr:heat-inducible transcription repressor HrcA [Pseudomonadales bacterium]